MHKKFIFSIFLFLTTYIHGDVKKLTSPPEDLPVKVTVHSYLLNFIDVDEKEESFKADVYFIFKWQDKRLSYDPNSDEKVKTFLETAVDEKFKEIWWPQIEFINAGSRFINNQILFIFPDGQIEYYLSITSSFYTPLDFKDFPFDAQTLKIKIDSFLWNEEVVRFELVKDKKLFGSDLKRIHNDLAILDMVDSIEVSEGISAGHNSSSSNYSTYVVAIDVKRQSSFFIYEIFVPLFLIFGISCSIFFVARDIPLDRIRLILACLLVFIATRFTINRSLPQIDYLTVVDKAFLITYLFLAFSVIISIVVSLYHVKRPEVAKNIDKYSRWVVPLLFTLSIAILIFLHYKLGGSNSA